MTGMREAKLTLRPVSPFLSPLQSDTLWGQVAWAIAYAEGVTEETDACQRFTGRYGKAGDPPLVVSDAFPAGALPMPVLWPLSRAEREWLAVQFYKEATPATGRAVTAALKQIGRLRHLDLAAWRELANELSPLAVAQRFFSLELCPRLGAPPGRVDCQVAFAGCPVLHEGGCLKPERWLERWLREHGPDEPAPVCLATSATLTKNTKNRLTDTTMAGAGSLYLQEEVVYTGLLEVRLLLAEDLAADLPRVRGWLEAVGMGGFGSGASVGKGRFKVDDLRLAPPDDPAGLPQPAGADGFMVLSAYVPRQGDPVDGWYRLRVKRGKLGGASAVALPVWKKPLLMCEPGSVFRAASPQPWYGRVVKDVSPFQPAAVQCGVALAAPLRLAAEPGAKAKGGGK